ncbi:MAG: T9SS type A sorting domain-containing protein [Cytophagaceae bacterium]|nr:T9SS type A sorting domain-containing protein [Cytophagaceae bacterium]
MKTLFTLMTVCFVYATVGAQSGNVNENGKRSNRRYSDSGIPVNVPPKSATMLTPEAFYMPCGANMETYKDEAGFWTTGSNGYSDLKFGYVFKNTTGGSISSVKAYLMNGYQGEDSDIYAELYSVGEDNLPSELLGTSEPFSTGDLVLDVIDEYTFNFATAVTVPTDFIAVITVPVWAEKSTDVAIASSPMGCYAPGTESYTIVYGNVYGTGTMDWIAMNKSYDVEPNGLFDLAIFPVLDDESGIHTERVHTLSAVPNPTKGELQLSGMETGNSQAVIYNITGSIVETQCVAPLRNGTAHLNVSHLPAGIYFVQTGNRTVKVVKE